MPDVVFVSETNSSAPANVCTVLFEPPEPVYTIKSVFGSEPSAAENPITFAVTWFPVFVVPVIVEPTNSERYVSVFNAP